MNEIDLTGIGAAAAAKAIAEGAISSEDLVRACLDRIAECDGEIEAWAFLDPEHALRSEEHTSELQSHSFSSYAVFCLKKKKYKQAGQIR